MGDKDRRLMGVDQAPGRRANPKRKRVARRQMKTSWKKARRQMKADEDGELKKKWEFVGTFDGSLDSSFYDLGKNYCVDKVHRVAYNACVDYNSNVSLQRNFA